jgi:predicted O-methyltransferase YrrM
MLSQMSNDEWTAVDNYRLGAQAVRRGSVIVIDNVVRNGRVIDPESKDSSVQGVRRLNEVMAREPRVSVTTIQTVGGKGYDGFAVALVISD